MSTGEFLLVVFVLFLVCLAAVFFEAGRASMRKEYRRALFEARCRECGAEPHARITHVSGCESGWPDPSNLFDGGR